MSLKTIGLNQGVHAGHFGEFVRNTATDTTVVMPNKKCGICGHSIGLETATRMTNLGNIN
jgi:broad specificity polyphosphatase/5'/3'-nucleotidase SurE